MTERASELRGCLLMVGWVYVVGLLAALAFVAWEALSTGVKNGFGWDSLYFIPLAVLWPLAIAILAMRSMSPCPSER